jgi:hypothetical protein
VTVVRQERKDIVKIDFGIRRCLGNNFDPEYPAGRLIWTIIENSRAFIRWIGAHRGRPKPAPMTPIELAGDR